MLSHGAVGMIDGNNPIQVNEAGEVEYPPPARFDENASANARPVEPIPTNQPGAWFGHSAWLAFRSKANALALGLVGALAIGTAGGAFLVKHHPASNANSPVMSEPAGGVSATQVPDFTITSPAGTAVSSQSAGQIKPGTRQSRRRLAARRPRARLVAVIK
jgi:hypothetical protein